MEIWWICQLTLKWITLLNKTFYLVHGFRSLYSTECAMATLKRTFGYAFRILRRKEKNMFMFHCLGTMSLSLLRGSFLVLYFGLESPVKTFFLCPPKMARLCLTTAPFFHRCSLWKLCKCLMFQTVDHDIDRMVRHPILYLRQMWMVDVYTFMSFFLYYTHTHYTCSCRGYGDMRHKNYAVRVVKNHALWKVSSRTKMELKRCWFWFKLTQNHNFLVSEYMPTVLPTCPRFQKGSNVLGRLV